MLRFVPDSWLYLLLRPLLLADPVGGLYTEIHAPDWRFLFLVLFLLIGKVADRQNALLNSVQLRVLLALTLGFYAWTFVSGNGRYFLWGLLAVGPLVVVAARRLPATLTMRNTVVIGVLALQGWVAWITYQPNVWAQRPWAHGPGLAPSTHRLAQQPAVFVTLGTNSQSILVPQMHPLSRWTNVAGQQDVVPGMLEWDRLQALLSSPLPKYGVIRAFKSIMSDDSQLTAAAWSVIDRALRRQGLAPTSHRCTFLRAELGGMSFDLLASTPYERGYWFCELERLPQSETENPERRSQAPELDDVFVQVERRCPRFFPSGNAQTRLLDDGAVRHYSQSDTSLSVNSEGAVFFQNMRAMNPTGLGTVAAVRAGNFKIDCDRLPGRYRAPWLRGWDVDLE